MQKGYILPYYKRLWRKATKETWAYYKDWTWGKCLYTILPVIVAALLYWLLGGAEAMLTEVGIAVGVGLATFVVLVFRRFVYNCIKAPVEMEYNRTKHLFQVAIGRQLPYNNRSNFGIKLIYDDNIPNCKVNKGKYVSYMVGIINTSQNSLYDIEIAVGEVNVWDNRTGKSDKCDVLTRQITAKPISVHPTNTPIRFEKVFGWDNSKGEMQLGGQNIKLEQEKDYDIKLLVTSKDTPETEWVMFIRLENGKLFVSCSDVVEV